MRLLYLTADPGVPVLGQKGASVHLREMAAALGAAGASVVIASARARPEGDKLDVDADLVELEPLRGEEHRSLASLRGAVAAQAAQVAQIAREHRVDAIYERLSLFGAGGVRAARLLGLPHVLEMNAPLCEEARRFRSLPHPEEAVRVEAEVCRSTDHVFAVSEALAERLGRAGHSPTRVSVAPNGINPAKFRSLPRRPQAQFTIAFVGSLKPWHGITVLLEAFTLALAQEPRLRLEIVGDGPEAARVEQARLPKASLLYHGPLPHAAAISVISTCDVGVAPFLPLRDFYFSPLKVVEYMAAGLCAVASDLGQIRTLLGRGERGVLVEPANSGALADAILGLAANPERAAALGTVARQYALGSLSWQVNAERVLSVLAARAA